MDAAPIKLTPAVETQGLKAYEQVRAFEELRRWRLPVCYVILPAIPLLNGVVLGRIGDEKAAQLCFFLMLLLIAGARWHWRRLCALYAKNLHIIRTMERTYGDQLPWVQIEKHFAALEQLQRELEEEKRR